MMRNPGTIQTHTSQSHFGVREGGGDRIGSGVGRGWDWWFGQGDVGVVGVGGGNLGLVVGVGLECEGL